MRTKGLAKLCAALALVAGVVLQGATAGVLFVSGDNNVTDTLGPANGNTTFFTNVLQGGTSVRVLDFNPGAFGSASDTDTELLNFYNGLAGVTATAIVGAVTPASLAGANLFLAPLPDDNFAPAEIAALQAFLTGGGTVFFLGENNNAVFTVGNTAINNALADLGSGLSLTADAITADTVVADPFTAGVVSLNNPAGSIVTGGSPLFTQGAAGPAAVAYERVGGQAVPEPATVALMALGLLAFAARRRKS